MNVVVFCCKYFVSVKMRKIKIVLRACRGCIYDIDGDVLCCPRLSPNVAADKMASEIICEAQDEKAALIEKDVHQQCATAAKQSEPKLRLYHWTQSFNSQKVSECSGVSGPPFNGQLLLSGFITYLIQ